jgi:molybdenum cofactor guanylyltransferase
MQSRTAGIILAGGRSTRMGTDKALLEIDGETMLARTARILSMVVSEVVIVGRTTLPPGMDKVTAIPDAYGDVGPLGGIATGLSRVTAEHVLVVSCDLPHLQADVLRFMVALAPGYDAVVPVTADGGKSGSSEREPGTRRQGGRARGPAPTKGAERSHSTARIRSQPACAVYAQRSLPVMLSRLEQGRFRLSEVLESLRVRWVSDADFGQVDPDGRSLLSANTPEEWRALLHEKASQEPNGS